MDREDVRTGKSAAETDEVQVWEPDEVWFYFCKPIETREIGGEGKEFKKFIWE